MSVVDLHSNLLQSLESALDTSKIFSVFSALMTIIKEQQEKIDDTDKKIKELYNQPQLVRPGAGGGGGSGGHLDHAIEKRLGALEDKIEEMAIALNGLGTEDPSILRAKEMTGYLAFESSAMAVVSAGEIAGALVDPLPFEPTDSLPPEAKKEEPVESQSVFDDDQAEVMVISHSQPTSLSQDELDRRKLGQRLRQDIQDEEEEDKAPAGDLQPGWFRPPPKTPPKTPPAPAGLLVDSFEPHAQDIARLKTADFRPLPPIHRVSFSVPEDKEVIEEPVAVALPASRQNFQRVTNAPVHVPVRRSSTGQYPSLDRVQPLQVSLDFKRPAARRKMTASNLPFLTKPRREKIVRELKSRGRFLQISRAMLEDARRRYANKSLKQKVEYLEAEIQRAHGQISQLQGSVKKNTVALKEKTSGLIDRLDGGLNPQLEILLHVIEGIGGMERFSFLLQNSATGQESVRDRSEDDLLSEEGIIKLKQQIVGEQDEKLKGALDAMSSEVKGELISKMTTKSDIDNMLAMPEIPPSSPAGLGKFGKGMAATRFSPLKANKNVNDPNNMKLIAMINHAISTVHDRIDLLEKHMVKQFEEIEAKAEEEKAQAPPSGELVELKANQYTDEKLTIMGRLIEQKLADVESRRNKTADDLVVVQMKMAAMEKNFKEGMGPDDTEGVRKEAVAIRELQKRVANIPVDKLMEEMKYVQKDLKTRALSKDVTEKIATTEDSLKSLLGENVVGLRSLLYEVFRHIQHKADREDIRELITSKLQQMEKELVKKEQEMIFSAATTTARCLSCGQTPGQGTFPHGSSSKLNSSNMPPKSPSATPSFVIDDELSEPHTTTQASQPHSTAQSEAVYSLLTGQAGLKPIHLQHNPLPPVQNPYPLPSPDVPTRASTASAGARFKAKSADKIPEPIYRKARLSQHVKEMVKVSASALQSQGFDLNANPLYVLDSYESAPGGLVTTDTGGEAPLINPFTDLNQPLSFVSLPKSATGKEGINMSKSTSSLTAGRAPRTAGNVLGSSGAEPGLQIASAKLHNGYL